ncbi:uncharacterized protein LOC128993778 [Macrosteles quadrilineatus]|uniref:uncharacterized protein LOC128993778 n=1 Tax=Macrosteles quadrilineatus TaxID=74068 RepID=UPI0023E0C7C4|nr:uncharacterized protein LOC128993778 [Macrosteles quadrilineatus]
MKMVYNTLLIVLFVFAVQNISVLMAEIPQKDPENVDKPNNQGEKQEGEVGKPKDEKKKEEEDPIATTERDIQTIKQGYIDKVISTYYGAASLDPVKLQMAIVLYRLANVDLFFNVEINCVGKDFMKIKGWTTCDDVITGLTDATTFTFSDLEQRVKETHKEEEIKSLDNLKEIETVMKGVVKGLLDRNMRQLHCFLIQNKQ